MHIMWMPTNHRHTQRPGTILPPNLLFTIRIKRQTALAAIFSTSQAAIPKRNFWSRLQVKPAIIQANRHATPSGR